MARIDSLPRAEVDPSLAAVIAEAEERLPQFMHQIDLEPGVQPLLEP